MRSRSYLSTTAARLALTLAGSAAALPMLSVASSAQQAAAPSEVQTLPPVVVQGAKLEAATKRKSTSGVDDVPGPAPQAKSKPKAPAASEPASAPAAASEATGPSGTGEGTPAATAGIPLDQIGGAVTVITGDQIRAQQTRNSADVLRGVPGVTVTRSGGIGNLTNVSLRGGASAHTLVLIDGVEVNDPSDGAFDFSSLSSEEIERMEVIRGPMSGVYGSKAVGGVINIVTKGGRGPLTLSARVEGGSFDGRNFALRGSGGNDKAYIALGYSQHDTNGFNIAPLGDEKDGTKLSNFTVKAGATVIDGVSLDMNLRSTHKNSDRDGFGGTSGFSTAVDDPSKLSTDLLVFGASLRWDSLDGALTQIVRGNHAHTTNIDEDRGSFGPTNTQNDGKLTKFAYLATYRFTSPAVLWAKHAVTGSVEREDEKFKPTGDYADGLERTRGRYSFAGEYTGDFFNRLTLTGNVRHDANDKFEDHNTWRTAASLRLPEIGVRPHASAGTAVKFPTMFEQFGNTERFVPNPLLKPEESFGWDAGVEFSFANGLAIFDVTYFHTDVQNAIKTLYTPKFTPVNTSGETERQGIELSARARVTRELTLGAAYTWLDTHDPQGLTEIRRPGDSARFDLDYRFLDGNGTFNVAAIYGGQRVDTTIDAITYATSRAMLNDHWLLNVAAAYKVSPGVELFARGENLLDSKYQEIYGYQPQGIAGFAGVRLTYEDPGTAAWAKYKD